MCPRQGLCSPQGALQGTPATAQIYEELVPARKAQRWVRLPGVGGSREDKTPKLRHMFIQGLANKKKVLELYPHPKHLAFVLLNLVQVATMEFPIRKEKQQAERKEATGSTTTLSCPFTFTSIRYKNKRPMSSVPGLGAAAAAGAGTRCF